ncbi:MAG: hypothetical protein P3W90_005710 [Paracoccus sp. (in: a-proteobacteria)]|nr:hypothetical protein [Paracoccus sp. (in: a-proteobacteria)]
MLETVLVVLTLADPGPPHVSFSMTESAQDCAARAEVVTQILTGAGYTILAQGCVETGLRISPYDHKARAFPYPWRVTLADSIQIEPSQDCTPDDAEKVVCAMSSQHVLPE